MLNIIQTICIYMHQNEYPTIMCFHFLKTREKTGQFLVNKEMKDKREKEPGYLQICRQSDSYLPL